jgi:hypothetical protein
MVDLNISGFSNVVRIGEIIKNDKQCKSKKFILYPSTLKLILDKNLSKELYQKQLSIVYIFTIDGIIKKIGRTDGGGGIKAGMSFYLNAGTDDPGLNRFAINRYMRETIEKTDEKVEIYMIYLDQIELEIPTLFGLRKTKTPISSTKMESVSISDYYKTTGKYPDWNYQESGNNIPGKLHQEYGEYKIKRGKALK